MYKQQNIKNITLRIFFTNCFFQIFQIFLQIYKLLNNFKSSADLLVFLLLSG